MSIERWTNAAGHSALRGDIFVHSIGALRATSRQSSHTCVITTHHASGVTVRPRVQRPQVLTSHIEQKAVQQYLGGKPGDRREKTTLMWGVSTVGVIAMALLKYTRCVHPRFAKSVSRWSSLGYQQPNAATKITLVINIRLKSRKECRFLPLVQDERDGLFGLVVAKGCRMYQRCAPNVWRKTKCARTEPSERPGVLLQAERQAEHLPATL
ncbi:hypothetical protein BV25DRAFT_807289 [Artomyces pyxidatus]|uniref:Uncharacterized protein n=1 Tax=Artomyces pyxidatus TaxID=48021 RepID=A0ACB8SX89_9AGAM|nr:hypothetical protein BV25DRAFT_807289 [Artomyces pyxidatus]